MITKRYKSAPVEWPKILSVVYLILKIVGVVLHFFGA
jgi:hypothetical protein